MATLKDMVDEIRSNLAGYTLRQDRITYLANPTGMSTTTTNVVIGSSSNLAKGVIEIDDELLWVDSFDKTNSTMTVIPGFGRGYGGTTPAPHNQYAQVTLAPSFPRVNIKKAINDTILSVFPKLWTVASTTFTYKPAQTTYALPDDCQDILQVSYEMTGATKEWMPVDRWRLDAMANVGAFNSNNSLTILGGVEPGRTVQVWYRTMPNTLDANTDDFSDVTGLSESARDVIILGASYRLLSYVDAGRLNLTSAEADFADSKSPSGAGSTAAKFLYSLYQQRLNDEAATLLGKYPIRIHWTR